ncbi:haloacid dehalogenase-like hydrolase domain-containing protein 3 [Sorghum bicolor]|nr:haloacid dehalogenase-like hydrolase domain-containing protein 3 [Sorghum bicolor]|eukprot:XP_021315572.1 haloacid dehalogenase-like hydrolase domain-containing protein 3 [Sorghum bicolor]
MILLYFPHQINVAPDSSCRSLKRRSVVAERKLSRSASMSSLLSRLRLVTVDVTGTLIAYRGQLGDYYCMAAKSAGMPCPDYARVHEGFKLAYADMSRRHPCFGHAAAMPTADWWWKTCVRDSFVRAGYDYDDETFERIFRRIYSTFGSAAPYAVFPDAQRFLRWLRKEGLVVGIVSNAEHRYRDVVLPALGLNQGSEWDFGVFSGVVGVEKPDPRIYEAALEQAAAVTGGVAPGEALHIGDSLRKDYAPARSLGMHALLLDRFRTAEAERWRRSGVPVLPDLVAAQEWLASPGGAADQPVTAR